MYQIVFALTVIAHFLFIGYVVAGGFLALRWRRTIWLHLAAVLWGAASVVGHVGCPLTGVERWARNRAGMPPLTSKGFIANYITGVFYPAGWMIAVHVVVAAIIAASWTIYVWRGRRREDVAVPADNRRISANG
ncbi:MAG: DUF2784 domain-containing protein [Mycobacterium sp.]|nr:DUF2784 domain-containing protein [Mycobacterium sp.]